MRLVGKHTELRPATPELVSDRYLAWMRDPEVTEYLEIRFQEHSLDGLKSYIESFDFESRFLFGIFSEGEHVGNINLQGNPHHGTGYIGYVLGERKVWGTPVAHEANLLTMKFAFEHQNLRKVVGSCYSSHVASIFNLKKLGFELEATQPRQWIHKGKEVDMVWFGYFRENWDGAKYPELKVQL